MYSVCIQYSSLMGVVALIHIFDKDLLFCKKKFSLLKYVLNRSDSDYALNCSN